MRLQRDPWEMVIRPERGGRITSLKLRGEELLDQGIGIDNPHADGFVEGGAWGWDEMVPNLEPTDTLPDHGEAWRMPWRVWSADATSAVMHASGKIVPWHLTRAVELADVVRVSYIYRNVGEAPHLAYWCAHPLFRYESGMDIPLAPVAEGASAKVFLPPRSVDRFRLGWQSGAAIEVSWDLPLAPYVAVWACNGDLGGYRQIAVEPFWTKPGLQPGESYSWWLQIAAL